MNDSKNATYPKIILITPYMHTCLPVMWGSSNYASKDKKVSAIAVSCIPRLSFPNYTLEEVQIFSWMSNNGVSLSSNENMLVNEKSGILLLHEPPSAAILKCIVELKNGDMDNFKHIIMGCTFSINYICGLEAFAVYATISIFLVILFFIVLYCVVLYCIAFHFILLYCIEIYFIVLYFILLYCTVLYDDCI